MKSRTSDSQRIVRESLYRATVSKDNSCFLHDCNKFSRDPIEETCDFPENESTLSVAGSDYRYVIAVVDSGFPEKSSGYDERFATLSGPSQGDELVLVSEESFLVFGGVEFQECFAELDRIYRDSVMSLAESSLRLLHREPMEKLLPSD